MENGILDSLTCTTEVSLLHAIFLGVPEGGCVSLGLGSLAVALLVFAFAVSGLQWIARRLIFGLPDAVQTSGGEGPILSTREEGNRRRAGLDRR
jgi:hypothetical protein